MLRSLLLLLLIAANSVPATAQFQYAFKDTTTPYVPLAGAASLNGSTIWDEENFVAPMAFTWAMDKTISGNVFNLSTTFPGLVSDTTEFADFNGFMLGDIDIADRGLVTGAASRSPIRYLTTGTAPNRIFKLELFNAGFWNEYDEYQTMNDSFNLQVWIYETKNTVELHFGPSRTTHLSDYFGYHVGADGLLFGYGKNADAYGYTKGKFYHVKGSPAAPALDSFSLPYGSMSPAALNAWPADGKVYRFTPKGAGATGIDKLAAERSIRTYPNPAHDRLMIKGLLSGDQVTIRTMVGQEVMSRAIGNTREALDISGLPAGSYMLIVSGRDGVRRTAPFAKR